MAAKTPARDHRGQVLYAHARMVPLGPRAVKGRPPSGAGSVGGREPSVARKSPPPAIFARDGPAQRHWSRPRPDRIDARSAALRPGVRPLWSRSCEPTRRSRRTASRLSTKSRTGWLALGMWLAGDGFHLIAVRDKAVPAFIQVAREQRSAADLAGRAERQARPAPGAPPPGPRHPLYSVAGRARSIATTRNRRRTPAPSSSVIKTRPG